MKWIVTAVLVTTVLVVGPGRIEPVGAASSQSALRASQASNVSSVLTDVSARRRYHHHHRYYHSGYRHYRYGYRPYYPRYYARPYYYEPYSYYAPAPLPFGFGFGFGPWW